MELPGGGSGDGVLMPAREGGGRVRREGERIGEQPGHVGLHPGRRLDEGRADAGSGRAAEGHRVNLADKIYIFDTTLRDGEQTPGVALTVDEKIQIAQKLSKIGVDKIEVGFPASSKGEIESAKKIKSLDLDSKIVGLARTVKEDIDAVVDADLEHDSTVFRRKF